MPWNGSCRLVKYLEYLTDEEMKKFKLFLSHSLPRGLMENAGRIEMAMLMVDHHGQQKAWDMAVNIWEKMGLTELWKQARGEDPLICNRRKYRRRMREKFQLLRDRNSRPGEHANLHHRFTQLLLLQEYRHKEQKEHELLATGWQHAEIMKQRGQFLVVTALFDPDEKTGVQPQTVVLQGAAGIGKTTLARKVMLDWAEGNLFQDRFNYVFYISCREMNQLVKRKISLANLIANDWPGSQVPMTEIMSFPEQLLFIIDGLDELKFPCDEHRYDLCKDWKQQCPVHIFLSSLLRKAMLPEASLLITTRLTALGKFSSLLETPCHVEILGFSEEERKEYFCRFFRDEDLAQKAFSSIKDNEILFTMCFVPLVSWIVCTSLKQQMERGQDLSQVSQTATSLYMSYLSNLFTPGERICSNHTLRGLCHLAAEGIWGKKILFDEEDLRRHGLEVDNVSAFLDMYIFQKDTGCENCYSFIHLSFQEFFAAVFYALWGEKVGSESPIAAHARVKGILEKCQETGSSFVTLTVHFLFGFLKEETSRKLEEIFSCQISQEVKLELLKWVHSEIEKYQKSSPDGQLLELLSFLYETQDEGFLTLAMHHVQEITLNIRTNMEFLILAFCLKHSHEVCRIRLAIKIFLPSVKYLHSLPYRLRCSHLSAFSWRDLFSVVSRNQNLRQLDLSSSHLGDSAMMILCSELRHPHCTVQKLRLDDCHLTVACCQDLSYALGSNHSLKNLNLSVNSLGNDGMKLLCKTLKNQNCSLQELRMFWCHLTDTCCQDLSSTLIQNQNLLHLDLAGNALKDDGVKLLCEALKHPHCQLQILVLWKCHLTSVSCEYLSFALISNQNLTHLDLSGNDLGDNGIMLLCEALGNQYCSINSLQLRSCGLTSSGCQDLSTALKKNRSVTHLNLADNALGNHGVTLLCEALGYPNCLLQELKLQGCSFSEACCWDLSSALKSNEKLTHLNLGGNTLGNDGVKLLCEAFRQPSCRLQEIKLWRSCFTAAGFLHLFAVLKSSHNLTHLNIAGNTLGDDEVNLLCEALKHPNCNLQKLILSRWQLSEEAQRMLDDIQESHPHLKIESSN
ncbi:NACHT, LRR and PYD domains-containing protein 3-like [Dromiciops gliroides]|uniref:NACHT, LRR and PYD domains-containing protein 3-like n=1 Tax=Dromiciops gliroides TaxID=33562 RepID=UPI001CC7CC6D|nr:NACHT, LRR and PYD domains-containing protein 3-like [Dromiciops gliroides]